MVEAKCLCFLFFVFYIYISLIIHQHQFQKYSSNEMPNSSKNNMYGLHSAFIPFFKMSAAHKNVT